MKAEMHGSLSPLGQAAPSPARRPNREALLSPQGPAGTWQRTANYNNTINMTTIKITTTLLPPPVTEPYYGPGAFPSVFY